MTNTHTWTDNVMETGVAQENPDAVNECLMHLKYDVGGLLLTNNLGTKTSDFTLDLNKVDLANITASLTISLPTTGFVAGVENKCILDFSSTINTGIILPTGCKWNGGVAPTTFSNLSGVRNRLTFITNDGGTTWGAEYETYGGVLKAFVQPTLLAEGTINGSAFAAHLTNTISSFTANLAFDNNASTTLSGQMGTSLIISNPIPLKVSSLDITNWSDSIIYGYVFYGSTNGGATYTILASGTNAVGASGTWNLPILQANQDFYSNWKLVVSSGSSGSAFAIKQMNINAQFMAQ